MQNAQARKPDYALLSQCFEVIINDDSLLAYGVKKGDTVNFLSHFHAIENTRVYLIYIKSLDEYYASPIYQVGSSYIIPATIDFWGMTVNASDAEILGVMPHLRLVT